MHLCYRIACLEQVLGNTELICNVSFLSVFFIWLLCCASVFPGNADTVSVSHFFQKTESPGEIKRRVGELDSHEGVRHFCGSRRDQEEEVVLEPQVSPEEIKSREVELGSESCTTFASVVTQQQCYGYCPCDSAPHSI